VPRVYEKAFSNAVANGLAEKGLAGTLFRVAMREFEKYAEAKEKGQSYSSFGFELARTLVFPEIKETLSKRFGGRIRTFVSAALRSSIRSPSSSTCSASISSKATASPRRSG